MRIFKTRAFNKWAKKHLVNDSLLKQAANEISTGRFEADLGSHVIKKRIATKGRGKSGSTRTIVVFKEKHHCFFVYGFEKGEKGNINPNEEKAFKIVAKELLILSEISLDKHVKEVKLIEVVYEEK